MAGLGHNPGGLVVSCRRGAAVLLCVPLPAPSRTPREPLLLLFPLTCSILWFSFPQWPPNAAVLGATPWCRDFPFAMITTKLRRRSKSLFSSSAAPTSSPSFLRAVADAPSRLSIDPSIQNPVPASRSYSIGNMPQLRTGHIHQPPFASDSESNQVPSPEFGRFLYPRRAEATPVPDDFYVIPSSLRLPPSELRPLEPRLPFSLCISSSPLHRVAGSARVSRAARTYDTATQVPVQRDCAAKLKRPSFLPRGDVVPTERLLPELLYKRDSGSFAMGIARGGQSQNWAPELQGLLAWDGMHWPSPPAPPGSPFKGRPRTRRSGTVEEKLAERRKGETGRVNQRGKNGRVARRKARGRETKQVRSVARRA
ncbi:hypothetical protein PSPO01_14831 [Paraphaeosphaeria sporulosa]